MKDITRIHIAKIAYDIELAAKKELEKYIAALERYAEDKEILDDIEIRITELLMERKVSAGDVINSDDVAAVRERLGEPSDFAPEESSQEVVEANHQGKRVYRDIDNAFVGGVLAGIARYFGINSLWTRLIFIVLLIPSFGTFLLVYVILWLIVPPARTAAEKLQSRGKPVTLESIKSLSASEKVNDAAQATRIVLRYLVGTALVIGGVGTLVAVGFISVGIFGLAQPGLNMVDSSEVGSWWIATAIILFTVAGALLAVLQFLLANATFRKVWSKRTSIAVVSVVAAGLITFATGLGFVWYGSWQENVRISEAYQTSTVDLDDNFAEVKSLTVTTDEKMSSIGNIEYIVSDNPRYELNALPGTKPQFTISKDGKSATLNLTYRSINDQNFRHYFSGGPALKIYGPALNSIDVQFGSTHYYNDSAQDSLSVSVANEQFSLAGTYQSVSIDSKDGTNVVLDDATIKNLDVKMASSDITAGVVRTLTVSQPEACPADDGYEENSLKVQAVSTDKFTYNDIERSIQSIKSNCGSVIIGSQNTWED